MQTQHWKYKCIIYFDLGDCKKGGILYMKYAVIEYRFVETEVQWNVGKRVLYMVLCT